MSLTGKLRDIIEQEGPRLSCTLAWGFLCWSGYERIFSIATHAKHCSLQLWHGAKLVGDFPDCIEGTGKALRHVKLRDLAEIDDKLARIIRGAIALDLSAPQKVR